jgi:hypothetical protein
MDVNSVGKSWRNVDGRGGGRISARDKSGKGRQQVAEKLLDWGSPCTDMHGRPRPDRSVPPEADKSARFHSRTMNKVVVVRPVCRGVVQGPGGSVAGWGEPGGLLGNAAQSQH